MRAVDPAADAAAVQNDDGTAASDELIGRGEAGDAGADHGDVGGLLALEGRRLCHHSIHPNRFGALVCDIHGAVS